MSGSQSPGAHISRSLSSLAVTRATHSQPSSILSNRRLSTWGVINPTNNPALPARTFHCAAAAASGTRIVVVGGFTDVITNPVTSDLAILDLTTNSWVPGQAISSANYGRAGPACGVSDDMVVIWGGERNTGVVSTNVTMVYNMKTNQWTSSFAPSTSSASPPTPSGSNNFGSGSVSGSGPGSSGGDGSSNSGKSSSNDGLIAGIAAGAVVILLVAGFLIHRRNMKRRQESKKN